MVLLKKYFQLLHNVERYSTIEIQKSLLIPSIVKNLYALTLYKCIGNQHLKIILAEFSILGVLVDNK